MDSFVYITHEAVDVLTSIFQAYSTVALGDFPHSNLFFVAGNALNAATKTAESHKGKPRPYWLHSLLLVILSGFGGGFLAPMLIGKPVMPAVNDAIIPMCIIAWYATHYMGLQGFLTSTPIKVIWTIWLALFRTHSVCNNVRNAMTVLKAGPYYPTPLMGPIICGTTVGSMGQFFPLDKGLSVVQNGTPWPMQGAFLSAVFYHLMINDTNGVLGQSLRALVGTYSENETKIIIASMQIINLVLQAVFHPDANIFTPLHNFLYLILQVDGPRGANAKKKELDTVGWNFDIRISLEKFLDISRFFVVFAAIAAHVYITLPSSSLGVHRPLHVGESIGTCQMFESIFHCKPHVLRFEQTGTSYRLASYLGTVHDVQKMNNASTPVWSYDFEVKSSDFSNVKSLDKASLRLTIDGELAVITPHGVGVSTNNNNSNPLWTSGHLCEGRNAVITQPRLTIANDGSAVVLCDPIDQHHPIALTHIGAK